MDKKPIKILFVCLGNICRSPAAEGILKTIVAQESAEAGWEIDSAGTGRWHIGDLPDSRMRKAAKKRGIDLTHRCRQVSIDDFYHMDYIIPMDSSNMRALQQMSPNPETDKKIIPMPRFFSESTRQLYDHVPDPYYEGAEGFELVLDLLHEGCTNLFNTLSNKDG